MTLVAEWFSLDELMVPQGVSVLMSVYVREWQYKDILKDIDMTAWRGKTYRKTFTRMCEREGRKSCLVKFATSLQVCTRANSQNKVRD